MEFRNYFNLLKRWVWLLLLCAALGGSLGYLASRLLKPTYQASAKILISKDLSDQNSQFAAMSSQQLIDTYVQMLTSTSVVDEASRRLNYTIDLPDIGQVQQVRTTPVIQITIEDGNPRRAAAIANTLVNVLIDQNTQASGYATSEENIKNSIAQVQDQISTLQTQVNQVSDEDLQVQLQQANNQIATLQDEVSKLSAEIGPLALRGYLNADQSSQLTEKQAQLAQLQSLLAQYQQLRINLEYFGKPALGSSNLGGDVHLQLLQSTLDQYQKIYLDLLNNQQTLQLASLRNLTTIDQIEIARPPTTPVRPLPVVYSILAGIVGLMLAIGAVFIIEYMDDTLKTPQDVQQAFDVPVLGDILNMKPISNTEQGLPVAGQLDLQSSDGLYGLLTNLEFAAANHPLRALLLLNANQSDDGKNGIATDLAVNYAQLGSKAVLLDADLRNPSIHRHFGLANENGFSDLLADPTKAESAGKKVKDLEGITVITSGSFSLARTRLLKPGKMVQILKLLKQRSDVVIIDGPSTSSADSLVLASKADGVLLVIQSGVTHLSEARQSLEQLNRAGATILGVVLYHIPHDLAYYFRRVRTLAEEVIKKRVSTLQSPDKKSA